jgi:O-antigen ligase
MSHLLNMKHLLGLLALAFFIVQPWDRLIADSIWLSLSLASLTYCIYLKITHKNTPIPSQLKPFLYLLALMPVISITSYVLSPLDGLSPTLLEPDTRWLLVVPIILAMRACHFNSHWVLCLLASYALSAFTISLMQTDFANNLQLRAEGDENAVSFGMFSATIAIMLLALAMSPYYKQFGNHLTAKLAVRSTLTTLAFLAISAAFFSGTRAALIVLPIAIAVLWAIYYSPKKAMIGTTVLLILGTLIFSLSPNSAVKYKLQHAQTNTINYFVIADKQSKLTSMGQRLEQWRESWCIFTRHPILGTGPRSFKFGHQKYGAAEHCNATQFLSQGSYQAHSLYFNTLTTLGIIGTLTLILLLAISLKIALQHIKHDDPQVQTGALLLISVLIAQCVNGLTLDLLFKNYMMDKHLLIWALPVILIFAPSLSKLTKK